MSTPLYMSHSISAGDGDAVDSSPVRGADAADSYGTPGSDETDSFPTRGADAAESSPTMGGSVFSPMMHISVSYTHLTLPTKA